MSLHSRLRISPPAAGLTILLAVVFAGYARQPLSHTDLWGHLAYGRWIADKGKLPTRDPFMPLAAASPVIDTAWMSQLAGYAIWQAGGPAALQFTHAAAIAACCGLLVLSVWRQTSSASASLLALGTFLALEWFQFQVIRPQIAGMVLFVALDTLFAVHSRAKWARWLVPVLFVVWANLHGSFVVGIGLIGLRAAGQVIDVTLRSRRLAPPLRNETGNTKPSVRVLCCGRRAVRMGILFGLATAAALVNPYGPRLYVEVATFAQNPNLRDLIEWTPLNFATWQGRIFAATAATLGILTTAAVFQRRRIAAAIWLPVLVFGLATIWSARMLVWWAPLAAGLVAVQFNGWQVRPKRAGVWDAPPAGPPAGEPRIGHTVWVLLAALAVIAAVASTPLMQAAAPGRPRDLRRLVSPQTPVAAVEWLRTNEPEGLVFNSYQWGDYLVWAGPPHVQAFVTSQVHAIPPRVWRDYREISRATAQGRKLLDEYGVATVLLDRARYARLVEQLVSDRQWTTQYIDDQAVILRREIR